jgi:myo-inositol 2-dehydrogenase / D-chiro-inositol 1-dehydrogenase
MIEKISRRDSFKKGFAAALAFQVLPSHVALGGDKAPSNQITRAVIGVGGMGKNHVAHMHYGKLLAICDVDAQHLSGVRGKSGDLKAYHDFREVLARPDIDVVHIATPPHWHALMSIAAADAGKDIWCEKPMTRTIGEGTKVIEAVRRNGRVMRVNTWFRFQRNLYGLGVPAKPIKKVVDHRLLGWPLTAVISTVSGGFGWKLDWAGKADLTPQNVPDHFDYDMWLGPAPYKPYHPHRTHQTFRGYWDYDGGGLGDMGQHYLDPVQYILGKDHTSPVSIEVDAPRQHPDAVGQWSLITMTYADGCKIILDAQNRLKDVPFLAGPEGALYRGFRSDIPGLREKVDRLPDPPPMVTEFAESVRTRAKFALNEINGHRSCTLVNLGKIALQLNRSLRFDPETMRFIGDPEANRLVNQPMRGAWNLDGGAV